MCETEGTAGRHGWWRFARKTGGFLVTALSWPITPGIRQKTRCGIDRQLAGWASSFLRRFGAAMLIGYVRVSKSDGTQTLAPQRDAMLTAGVDPTRIYEDLASGRHDARPGLTACLKAIQPGNTLVLWKLDRLGRDLRHLVNTVEDLRTRGVGLKVLTGAGAQIDTTTANGRIAFGIFAAFAEFERELIAERTMAGLAAARARGRMGGRPRKMDRATLMMAMSAMSDRKAVAAEVAKRLNLTTTTLYTYVNGDGTPKAAGQALLDGGHRPVMAAKARSRRHAHAGTGV
jgi:DNA invertase Pin-like site-specific DNA recombinase